MNMVNGIRIPILRQEDVDKIKHIQLFEDDVWVASYPKSGSTWMQQIVKLIKNKGEPSDEKVSISVPWLEALPQLHPELVDKIHKIPHPRVFKTHFPYHSLPCGVPNSIPHLHSLKSKGCCSVRVFSSFTGWLQLSF